MLRVALIVFLMAGVTLAAPGYGSWTGHYWGADPSDSLLPEERSCADNQVLVYTGPTASFVDAYVYTGPDVEDQEHFNDGLSTAWFGLSFSGSPNATGHRWRITTTIKGSGWAYATSNLDASSWAESLQAIVISGDHQNSATGHVAVQDNADVGLALSFPPGLGVSIQKKERSLTRDEFSVSSSRCTSGSGKCCRVRVDNTASAKAAASSAIHISAAWIGARFDAEIELVGFCVFDGITVKDRYAMTDNIEDPTNAEVTPPTGGIVAEGSEIPTDAPTEDEREGKEEDEKVIDAEDLPKLLPSDFEDKPPVESGTEVKED